MLASRKAAEGKTEAGFVRSLYEAPGYRRVTGLAPSTPTGCGNHLVTRSPLQHNLPENRGSAS
jgi:hypothetical protein